MFKDVERNRARFARVQVPRIFARPAKSFSVYPLHAFALDLSRLPKLEFRFREVIPHDTDKPDWREEACAKSRIGSRTTQQIRMLLHRCLDRIECDGTDNQQRHGSSDCRVEK